MVNTLESKKPSPYRWLMLVLVALPNFGTNYAQFQLSAFSAGFMSDFGLSATQFSAVTLSYSVVAGIIGVCGGTLADRLGTRRVVISLGIISAAASLLRLLTSSYAVFFALSLLVGAVLGSVHATSGKIISAWFPERQTGLAFSLYCAIGAGGIALAQLTSQLYSGYRQALLVSGCILVLGVVMWIIFGKNAPEGVTPPPSQPVMKYIGKVVKLRNVWIIGICNACFCAALFSVSALLPQVLTSARGMESARANSITSMLNITAIIGSVLIPFLQVRLGKYRPLLMTLMLLSAISIIPMSFVGDGGILPLVCLLGFFLSVGCAYFMAILAGLPEVGGEYLGSATGIVTLMQYALGGFAIPSFIITPLMEANSTWLFVCGAALCVLMALGTFLLPETGEKAAGHKSQ